MLNLKIKNFILLNDVASTYPVHFDATEIRAIEGCAINDKLSSVIHIHGGKFWVKETPEEVWEKILAAAKKDFAHD